MISEEEKHKQQLESENKQTEKKKPNLRRDIQKQKNRTETGNEKWILKSMNNGKLTSQH